MKGIYTVIYGDTRWHPDINSVKEAFDPNLIPLLFSARAKTVFNAFRQSVWTPQLVYVFAMLLLSIHTSFV